MRLVQRVESLEGRASGLPKPDPRYPEWVRLVEEATARRQVRSATRELVAFMWQKSGHSPRAVAVRRREADLMRELDEAWTALGEQGRAKFQQAARALLEGMKNQGVPKPSGTTR